MKADISVIIPVYNAKEYIFYTVDSLLGQTKKEIEILLIDDCSTDGSAELLEERYGSDERVRLIRQPKNGGPGIARNTGIELAQGEYITFCDSDDQVKEDCYEKMYAVAKDYDADVVHSTGCLISMMDKTPIDMLTVKDQDWCACETDHPAAKEVTLVTEPMDVIFDNWCTHAYHWAIWNKLFRRSLLMEYNVRFGKMRLAEDEEFCLNILMRSKRYVLMPGFWYCYRQVENSASRGKRDIGYLVKALTASFEAMEGLKDMADITYFAENKDKMNKAAEIILEGLESSFIRPACRALGIEAIKSSQEVRAVFEKYLANQADWAFKSFCDAHSNLPDEKDIMELVNTPEGLRMLIGKGVIKSLEQVKKAEEA